MSTSQSKSERLINGQRKESDLVGVVVRIQRFSLDDGPGIRTTVFLKGCPLRCLWCSNPETQSPEIEIAWYSKLCSSECTDCVEVCNAGALSRIGGKIKIKRTECTLCGKCIIVCEKGALAQIGSVMRVSSVVNEVEKDAAFYRKSGGGVTISGGEPMFQPYFTMALAKKCCERGVSVALDTCGFSDWDSFANIAPYINLYLYDVKHLDPLIHKKLTGVDNAIILENLKRISSLGTPIILRMPLIPGVNDSDDNLVALARLVMGTDNIICVHLLPYHNLGVGKYESIGREYAFYGQRKPSREDIKRIWEKLTRYGICVKTLGQY